MYRLVKLSPLLLLAALFGCGMEGGGGGNSGAPVITSFSANPASIAAGQSAQLSWVVTGSPTSLSISSDVGTSIGTVTGTNTIVTPTATTTYTLTATNSSSSDTATILVTVGGTPTGEDGLPPSGSFGVSSTQTGTFQNDVGGNITSATDPRVVNVAAGGTFYAQAAYSDPGGISNISIELRNSSPEGLAAPLVQGQSVSGFTLGAEVSGCVLDGTQTAVSCVYPITVAPGTPNISALPGAGGEFAYVFRTVVTDAAGNFVDEPPRGYVTVGSGGGTPAPNPNPGPNPGPNPDPGPTPNPNPNPNPGPTAPTINSFTASPSTINTSQSSLLSWNVSGTVTSLSINNGVGSVTGTTSESVSPDDTTTYTLTASNGTASVTKTATVTVSSGSGGGGGGTGATKITAFNAAPTNVTFGESVNFTWSLSGTQPSEVEIFQEGNSTPVLANLVGKTSDSSFKPTTTANYYLEVTSEGDVIRSPVKRVIVATAINGYKATPARVPASNPTTLSWSLSGPAPTSISITPPGEAAFPVTVNTTGSYSVIVSSPTTGTYVLTVKNPTATSTANTSVTVNAVINTFAPTPASPVNGADFTLTWTATGADGYTVSLKEPGETSFETLSGVDPNGDDVVRTAQDGIYTLKLQSGPNSVTKPLVLTVR